jgi:ubiquinone/menaquinone biosynthesis C-methylase UbiE
MQEPVPWQLKMFQKTLKKKLRLRAFKKYLGTISPDKKCFLITCGDNNGAMNYYLRELGGKWFWADMESANILEMAELLGEEVKLVQHDNLPFPDERFDYVISIDVHEHIKDPYSFPRELWRVTKNSGRILITVPSGDKKKLINKLKDKIGMTKEKYGHTKDGYSSAELREMMQSANIKVVNVSTFSRFFTEFIELGINFLYVNFLSKKSSTAVKEGTIAPQSQDQLKSIEKTIRLYSLVYPFFWMFSQLDHLLFFREGYVVLMEGKKSGIKKSQ